MAQHRWHKEIKEWADGAEVETRQKHYGNWTEWYTVDSPQWYLKEGTEYRIKPQPKKPQYLYVYIDESGVTLSEHKSVFKNGTPYRGKIKLEDEC